MSALAPSSYPFVSTIVGKGWSPFGKMIRSSLRVRVGVGLPGKATIQPKIVNNLPNGTQTSILTW